MPPNTQRLMELGQLTELRKTLEKVLSRVRGIVLSIQVDVNLDLLASPLDINAQDIAHYGEELKAVVAEGNNLRNRIEKLEEKLGLE